MSQIEEKINHIDEKLTDLKLSITVPNYGDLLNKFTWTRDWFISIEEVLIALAFRGESDKPVLDFIRTKIRETDVITFNKTFIQIHKLPEVRNHYEDILRTGTTSVHILQSKNNAIINAALDYYIDISTLARWDLAGCLNDRVVDYLLDNPKYIVNSWMYNTNPKAAKYCIEHNMIKPDILSLVEDDYIVEYLIKNPHLIIHECFSRNPNDKAVNYILNASLILMNLSRNTNDRVVDYLIANPLYINWERFSCNTNEKAIDYLLQNPDKIYEQNFFQIKNKKVVDYMMPHLHRIDFSILLSHSDDRIVDYLLDNVDKIHVTEFCYSENYRVIEYLMNKEDKEFYAVFIALNTYDYYTQKINAFNAAGMFPRLPHLRL
jgi:hypothetical protein